MSVRQKMQEYILAHPGAFLRDIAIGIGDGQGKGPRENITSMSAQLYQLVQAGRLRSVLQPGKGNQYFPTSSTGVYRAALTPEQRLARQRDRSKRKTQRAREKRIAQRAAAPIPRQQIRPKPRATAALPPPAPRSASMRGKETVAEFQARGGKIQHLQPTVCTSQHALRHDYSTQPSRPARLSR